MSHDTDFSQFPVLNEEPLTCRCAGFCAAPRDKQKLAERCDFMDLDDTECTVLLRRCSFLVEVFECGSAADRRTQDSSNSSNIHRKYCILCSSRDLLFLTPRRSKWELLRNPDNSNSHSNEKSITNISAKNLDENEIVYTVDTDFLQNPSQALEVSRYKDSIKTVKPTSVVQEFVVIHKDSLSVVRTGQKKSAQLKFSALVAFVNDAYVLDPHLKPAAFSQKSTVHRPNSCSLDI